MKNNKILNISIVSTLLLFSACSNSQKRIKQEPVSVYTIMGITEGNKNFVEQIEYVEANQYVQANEYVEHKDYTPSDITYISYKKNQNNAAADISYVSYKKENSNNYFIDQNLQVIQDIENKAKSFLGVPYVWGATGPSKFDCSGFTQWVYRDSGINIPRVSKDQARVGQFISYDNLQRGDMVFFNTTKKRTGKVTHVGIYLGNNDFIHASSAGKSVVIYNFNEKTFYKKRFLWGRRVLNPNAHYALN